MLKVNIHLFGVPGQFESYPAQTLTTYYQQFYGRRPEPWRFLVRCDGNFVRYIYIKYGLISGVNRAGSLIGISVELDGYYFKTPRTQVLLALKEILGKLLADAVILSATNSDAAKFSVASFDEASTYLKTKITQFERLFESNFQDDALKLPTKFDNSSTDKVVQFGENEKNDEEIIRYFLQYGDINIIPNNVKKDAKPTIGGQIVTISSQEREYRNDILLLKQNVEDERNKAEAERVRADREQQKREAVEKQLEALKQKKDNEVKASEITSDKLESPLPGHQILPANVLFDEFPEQESGRDNNFLRGRSVSWSSIAFLIIGVVIITIGFVYYTDNSSPEYDMNNKGESDANSEQYLFNDPKNATESGKSVESIKPGKPPKPVQPMDSVREQISNLNGKIADYLATMPSSEYIDEKYLEEATVLGCKLQVQEKLDKHKADAMLFSVMVTDKDPDITMLKTLSYQIAILLRKNHSDDEIISHLKEIGIDITTSKIQKVRNNLSSF